MDRSIIVELIKSQTVTDIIVVALLRVNGTSIKENLSKALFNLLSRAEFRTEMVDLGVLSAMMELAKLESTEVLELCTRCVYNITCQTDKFADKLKSLGVPSFLLARASGFKSHEFVKAVNSSTSENFAASASVQKKQDELSEMGLISSTTVKLLCAMGLANISFARPLALLLCCDMGTDAILSAQRLQSDQSAYCAAVVIFNTSLLSESVIFCNFCCCRFRFALQ